MSSSSSSKMAASFLHFTRSRFKLDSYTCRFTETWKHASITTINDYTPTYIHTHMIQSCSCREFDNCFTYWNSLLYMYILFILCCVLGTYHVHVYVCMYMYVSMMYVCNYVNVHVLISLTKCSCDCNTDKETVMAFMKTSPLPDSD